MCRAPPLAIVDGVRGTADEGGSDGLASGAQIKREGKMAYMAYKVVSCEKVGKQHVAKVRGGARHHLTEARFTYMAMHLSRGQLPGGELYF